MVDVRSDTQRQDQERTRTRDNESGAGCQKDHGNLKWHGHVRRRDEEHILRKVQRPGKNEKTRANDT